MARKGQRRPKTDRIDIDMLLRTLLAWLRGEPRVCSMVRIPTVEEEDARRPGREREVLVRDRVLLENRINSLLVLHGIVGFKARLKNAMDRLEALRTPTRSAVPANTMKELRRLLARHRLICEQIKEIETQRDQVIAKLDPNREEQIIQRLVSIVGLGTATATTLAKEMLWCSFRDRKALAKYAGLTQSMLLARASLLAEFNKLHKAVLKIVREDKVCRQFMTAPGVGAVVSITYRSAVDDPGCVKTPTLL